MNENTILLAILYLVVGGIACFYGYRLFRIMLALVGFAAGVLFALAMIDLFVIETDANMIIDYAETIDELSAESSLVGLAVTIAIGLVSALLVQVFYRVGVFLLAGSAAMYITFALLSNDQSLDDEFRLFLMLFAFGVAGIFALRIERYVLILSTSLLGAFFVVLAGYLVLAENNPQLDQPFGDTALGTSSGVIILILWLVLAIAGASKQFGDANDLFDVV